jgi:putative salt-induced outer membrane protein YdiY
VSTRLRRHAKTTTLLRGFFAGLILHGLLAATSCASKTSMDDDREIETATSAREEGLPKAEFPSDSDAAYEFDARFDIESGRDPDSAAGVQTSADKRAKAWKPPEPGKDEFDWIRLKSGEWLKGDITYLRNRTLEFDSDELNELKLDWKDVVEVRSPRMNTVLFEGQVQHTGTLLIRDDVVLVGGDEPRTYALDQLVSIVPGEEKESDYWSGKISVGTTFRSGNTDQTDVTARGTIYRRTALTRTTIDYTGAITTIDGREEVNNHRAAAAYNVYLTTDFYLIPFAIEYYKDRIANVRHRVTPGSGAGYWLLDTPDVDWNVDLLGAYRYTEFDTVEAGENRTDKTAAAIVASKFDWEVTSTVDLILEYRIDVGLSDITDTNHHAVSTLSVELTKILDLDVSFIWDRVGKPQRDDDGDTPEKDDFRLVVGLGVDF